MTHTPRLPLIPVFAALFAALLTLPALAEKADREKPMNIEADSLRYDDLNQTSVFTGNVVLTKGTLLMRGARIDVRQDPEGYQYATVVSAPGKQTYYKQKREGVDETVEAEADNTYYDGKADVITFTKAAVLRRYKGNKLNDETQGSLITYDNTTDIFTVESSVGRPGVSGTAATSTNPSGRIRAMLTPRAATESASAATGTTPPPTPPAPASLRKSPQLGDGAGTGSAK